MAQFKITNNTAHPTNVSNPALGSTVVQLAPLETKTVDISPDTLFLLQDQFAELAKRPQVNGGPAFSISPVADMNVKGDVTIDGGDDNVITSGVIDGNLVVKGQAKVNFAFLIVTGDVDLDDAAAVSWRGGHFEGALTDTPEHLGAAPPAAGDYLFVIAP